MINKTTNFSMCSVAIIAKANDEFDRWWNLIYFYFFDYKDENLKIIVKNENTIDLYVNENWWESFSKKKTTLFFYFSVFSSGAYNFKYYYMPKKVLYYMPKKVYVVEIRKKNRIMIIKINISIKTLFWFFLFCIINSYIFLLYYFDENILCIVFREKLWWTLLTMEYVRFKRNLNSRLDSMIQLEVKIKTHKSKDQKHRSKALYKIVEIIFRMSKIQNFTFLKIV